MAKTYQTPGVYIQETSILPPSVAEVASAVPVFICYTQKRPGAAAQRIKSPAEYELAFGPSDYLKLFFANGGGDCYIVSVGLTNAPITATDILSGLAIAAKLDEPTLIVMPQVHLLPALADALTVYNAALQQAATRRDRFVIMDCYGDDPASIRNPGLAGNLSYGAAYHPFLKVGALTIPPACAIAGIYNQVDSSRGVWKAPANINLNAITGLTKTIDSAHQEGLNVDPVAGKSINVIRPFTGKGFLVWGARTLAGNDNEWRYISIRRLFIMVEESLQKALEQFVFEPNTANTWVKTQAMVENYLHTLWRLGALVGAKPEEAFYVSVGLGKTMTSTDVLEGRMIVEMGLATVRPAEFIILRISIKLAQS